MTTGNDPALTNDGQQQQPLDNQQPNGNTPPADGGERKALTFTEPQPEQPDEDDVALAKVLAAAEAEEAAAKGQQPPVEGDVKDPARTAPADPKNQQQTNGQQQQPSGDQPMIPKARFDEVNSGYSKVREENAFLRGQVEALKHQPVAQANGQQQQQPQTLTHEQRLVDISTKQDALAKRFDEGEITMADFKREERVLDNEAQAIREEKLAAKFRPAQVQQPTSHDDGLYLNQLTAKIEADHPWVAVFEQVGGAEGTDADWDYIANIAKANLKRQGIALNGTDAARYALRKEIGVQADKYGPALLSDRAKTLGIKLPGAQQQQQTQQNPPPLSPEATARKKALEKAANAPPDLANLNGNPGDPAGTMSDERLENIKEDDFDSLPQSLRQRLLGVSA